MATRLVTCVLFLLLKLTVVVSQDWSYDGEDGPSTWHKAYPWCGGSKQSPIDIDTSGVWHEQLTNLALVGYNQPPSSMIMTNTGHTASVAVSDGITVSEAGLSGTRRISQFHFHWGSNETEGSEHRINSDQYAMEMHVVHYDEKYGDFEAASKEPNGLAIISVLFQEADNDNPALAEIVKNLHNVVNKDSSVRLQPFPMRILLPTNLRDFYRYNGSLTTPACYQSAEWVVLQEKMTISRAQLEEFGTIHNIEGRNQGNNFRPTQDLNGRVVIATFYVNSAPPTKPTGPIILTFIALILFTVPPGYH